MIDPKDRIVILKGAERVRRRPAVIFGDDGIEGVMTAFEMLLHTLSKEGIKGFSKQLTVTRFRDASIGIRDFGRGLELSDDNWKALFCELYAGSAYADDPDDWDSLWLCAVQYASDYMDVRVCRDGQESSLRFEKGENVGGITRKPSTEASGTYIRFKPDGAVFTQTALSAEALAHKANALALVIPGLQVTFRTEGETGFAETVYCYPEGIADYLKTRSASPVYTAQLEAQGQERYNRPHYTAKVRLGIGFSEEPGFIACYHNQKELTHGGSHVDKLVDEIHKFLEWTLGLNITNAQLLSRLQLVVVTEAGITAWTNGTRKSIENILIRDMAQDTVGENFRQYVKENCTILAPLFQPEK